MPNTSVADYLGLAEFTGNHVDVGWREVGALHLSRSGLANPDAGKFLIGLGMKHDPCPYLDDKDEFKCKLYGTDGRPLMCDLFPGNLAVTEHDSPERSLIRAGAEGGYQCLAGDVDFTREEMLVARFQPLLARQGALDKKYFWKGLGKECLVKGPDGELYTPNADRTKIAAVLISAVTEQARRDPELISETSTALTRGSSHVRDAIASYDFLGSFEASVVNNMEYMISLGNVLSPLLQEDIARRLREIAEGPAADEYREILEERKRLRAEIRQARN
jgi:Fe-S-cluster containining protein